MIISVANQKGGVGKTTTSVNLGDLAARSGLSVCIVDTDVQGHVGVSLDIGKVNGLFRLLVYNDPIRSVAVHARTRLDVIPSDKNTEVAKLIVAGKPFRERILSDALATAQYDLILIDLAPSMDILHIAALMASDYVVIPTRLDQLALDGVSELILSIKELDQQGGHIRDYRILPTFYDRVTKESTTNLQELVGPFGARVWPPIPQDVRAREASAFGKTLAEYAPASPAMVGYQVKAGQRIGGYQEAFARLQELIHG